MQVAVIEFARHVCGIPDATSGELDSGAKHKVIDFLPDQSDLVSKGGTLRLGAYPCRILENTCMRSCYGAEEIRERHRHRYEFNNDYREVLSDNGMCLCGRSPDGNIIEAVELSEKRFFVGVQFHPEFHSRPNRPHPLFIGLLRASLAE
jgi:CTP synthase